MTKSNSLRAGFAISLALSLGISCSSKPKGRDIKSEAAPRAAAKKKPSHSTVSYKLRPYTEKVLPNGLKVLFIEDQTLPYVSYALMVKGGSSVDPSEQQGLSEFVADMLDTGTAKHSAMQLATELGKLGTEFESQTNEDYNYFTMSALAMDAEQVLAYFHEIVTSPTFPDIEIARIRKEIESHIIRRVDNPASYASEAFERYLYGNHPYGSASAGTLKSLAAIKKKQIIQHYLKYYRPNNSYLAVVGKYNPQLVEKITQQMGTWQARDVQAPAFGEVPAIRGVQLRLIDNPGTVQAQIRIGSKGLKRQTPDFIPARVANTILGGAYASRLVDQVRQKLGLTYDIQSSFSPRADFGPFEISTFSKNETVGQTIAETLNVIKNFREKGPTSDEMDRVKGYLKGTFPQAIETGERLAFNLLTLRLYGVPDTYLSTYLQSVDEVSLSDVNKAVQKYFDERNMKVVVYGSAKDILPQLQTLGAVEVKQPSELE